MGLSETVVLNLPDATKGALSQPDVTGAYQPYGPAIQAADLVEIPAYDLPAGSPDWMRGSDWAQCTGATATDKRYTITVTVPAAGRT